MKVARTVRREAIRILISISNAATQRGEEVDPTIYYHILLRFLNRLLLFL